MFRRELLRWYHANQRDLPWRKNKDAYRVWLSEIMLQQTRVAAVVEHYLEFLRRFPSIQQLASASEQEVLSAWSGLGYYRRARMLHAAAKEIVTQHEGQIPPVARELEKLPGIGLYTAAAIASIVFGEPVAVVDGNVERVLNRCVGRSLARKEAWSQASELLDRRRPGDFNQAMMELGATVCTPRQPQCLVCPVMAFCKTKGVGVREGNPERQIRANIYYVLSRRNGSVFLRQRPANAPLMPTMWELPEVISQPRDSAPLFTLRHSITVTDYTVKVRSGRPPAGLAGKWVLTTKLDRVALTGLARKILRKADLLRHGNTVR